ncbi:hypothetical protein E8E12_005744 [Didymella heteroderae]|uniref:Zn(2)-C6 fungal-type domain-containing protein n=1 Tax=Didymella heteroderae TaxID=1769908 RepID=A0A9P4WJF3_9PLEO|nr:hypothetical protein E8E12_005744 [Didymella heteroderae]
MDDLDDELDLRYHRGGKPDVYYRVPIAAIEEADGFKYFERHAFNPKIGGDGARLNYVCQDSLQNKDRKANKKKKEADPEGGDDSATASKDLTPTYDCGGAIHVKFSIRREAINVVYKHNPVHRDVESRRSGDDVSAVPEANGLATPKVAKTLNGSAKKRKPSKKDHLIAIDNEFHNPDLNMSTSPEAPKSSASKKRKSNGTEPGPSKSSTKKGETAKASTVSTPVKSQEKAVPKQPSPPPRLARNKACIRCREKKIKCNEAKPACNQCKRGLWTCQYAVVGPKPRAKNGCINCKQRRRKCTEERPLCAYCLKVDDDCEYTEYA